MRHASRLALSLAVTLWTAACRASDLVAAFDAAIAAGLPTNLILPAAEGAAGGERVLSIDRALASEVEIPGKGPVRMYHAHLAGSPATITRSGTSLHISLATADGMDILAPGKDGAIRTTHLGAHTGAGNRPVTRARRAVDPRQRSPFVHVAGADDLPLADVGEIQPLRVFFFLHDDLVQPIKTDQMAWIYGRGPAAPVSLGDLIEEIHAAHVAWWLDELERDLIPGEPIRVVYRAGMPGLTDARYGAETTLTDWAFALGQQASRYKLPWLASFRHKFVLLVPGSVAPGIAGKAHIEGAAAVASLADRYSTVAHELGHTLGASHDDAEVRFAGLWWCQTTMYAWVNPFLTSCLAYSQANRERIRDYYSGGPGRPRAQGQVMDETSD